MSAALRALACALGLLVGAGAAAEVPEPMLPDPTGALLEFLEGRVVVAHNGDGIDDGAVSWRFGGETMRDREVELLVTSVVKR